MNNKNVAILVIFFLFIAAIVGFVMYMMRGVVTESMSSTEGQVEPTVITEVINRTEPTIETTISPAEDPSKSIDDTINEIEEGLGDLDVDNDLPEVN
jgi:flagellar basal body-associated protein FliL